MELTLSLRHSLGFVLAHNVTRTLKANSLRRCSSSLLRWSMFYLTKTPEVSLVQTCCSVFPYEERCVSTDLSSSRLCTRLATYFCSLLHALCVHRHNGALCVRGRSRAYWSTRLDIWLRSFANDVQGTGPNTSSDWVRTNLQNHSCIYWSPSQRRRNDKVPRA